MLTLLLVGLLLGMKHALDADHVAAVAALATRSTSFKDTVRQGIVWGAGHTLTLLAFGGAVLAMDANIPEGTADALEFAVGAMLMLLGLDVLRRAHRQKTHLHAHRHTGGIVHFHAHSHADDQAPHDSEHHQHPHVKAFPLRALAVGMMHGMAGSAALLLLTARAAESVSLGLLQIAVFGVGSMLGMGALSAAIALPLQRSARWTAGAHLALQWLVGVSTAVLGGVVMVQIAAGS